MPRRTIRQPPPSAERSTFVGRVRECAEFRASVRLLLGSDTPPASAPNYAHIFLLHGEGGMGKSTLLRQFARIASEENLPAERTIVIKLDSANLPAPDALAQLLADEIGIRQPGFDRRYRALCARRATFADRRDELRQQWERWQALQNSASAASDESQALRWTLQRRLAHEQHQAAKFGAYTPYHIAADADDMRDELALLTPLDELLGYTPGSFDDLLRRELGNDDAALFAEDGRTLGKALCDDLFDLAEAAPLLLALDTYEHADAHDDWLRETILADASDRMLVVLAGRNRLPGYDRTFEGDSTWLRFCNLNEQTLKEHEIRDYLGARLDLPDEPPAALVAEVAAISRGIPLAVNALGDQLAGGGDLAAYQGVDLAQLDRRAVVRTITDRFLHYAQDRRGDDSATRQRNQRDRQRIRALALLPPGRKPDELLACALWDVPPEHIRDVFAELAARHSFVFQDGLYTLHDLVHEFVRADTLDQRGRSADWPALEAALRRALTLIEARIAHAEQRTADPDDRYADSAWRTATLDKLNALLWLGEDDAAQRLLLNRWVEAQCNLPDFASELEALVIEIMPYTHNWKRMVGAIKVDDYEIFTKLSGLFEAHISSKLYYLRAKQIIIEEVTNENDLERLQGKLSLLEEGYNENTNWLPIQTALVEAYILWGNYIRLVKKDYLESIPFYNQALKVDANNLEALFGRGVALFKILEPEKSLVDFNHYLKIKSKSPNILFYCGRIKHILGDLASALADYNKALELRPTHHTALWRRGWVKYDQGDIVGAIADHNQSLAVNPDDAVTLDSIGLLKGRIGDFEGALPHLDRALAINPDAPLTRNKRGRAKVELGDLSGALPDFLEALRLKPDFSRPVYNIACVYALQKQTELALEWLSRAMEMDAAWQSYARTHPDFAPIRADPRFIALVGGGAEPPRATDAAPPSAAAQ